MRKIGLREREMNGSVLESRYQPPNREDEQYLAYLTLIAIATFREHKPEDQVLQTLYYSMESHLVIVWRWWSKGVRDQPWQNHGLDSETTKIRDHFLVAFENKLEVTDGTYGVVRYATPFLGVTMVIHF
ncbi:hypothetical protein IW261DRAFT_1414945 [Armillaria novae-zelandiae]|uniref:Uncharacterized protein n=1 Tax=Armillaria novae-zelandiae TaxID=153914 RepID=A0AA39PN86_9AGAR|nr:hypothetical protein IW261DRAFT_1414945 [Armillaria novae-zelandiae]